MFDVFYSKMILRIFEAVCFMYQTFRVSCGMRKTVIYILGDGNVSGDSDCFLYGGREIFWQVAILRIKFIK